MSKKITVDVAALEKIKSEKLTPKTRTDIKNLLSLREQIDELIENLGEKFSKDMEKEGIKLIEWDGVKITRVVSGRKYSFNPKESVDKSFVKQVQYFNVDSEAVEKYLQENGGLPQGIIQKGRPIKVKFELKGGEKNE